MISVYGFYVLVINKVTYLYSLSLFVDLMHLLHFLTGSNLTSPTGTCQEGYYCVSGADKANPVMLNNTQCPTDTVHPIIGNTCPPGHYCPKGTKYPVGCPSGTYQDLANQKDCKSCPEGFFCLANTSDYSVNICPPGYYCSVNTTDRYQHACGAGTFNNLTQQKDAGACVSCTPGTYCQGAGNAAPTGNCSAGWYCTGGSSQAHVNSFLVVDLLSTLFS